MGSNAAPGPSDIILEDTDPRVIYDAFSTWTTSTDGSLSDLGSTYHYTDTRGAWVSCTFVGTHIWYIANTKYNHGNNSVTVDAISPVVFSSYSPELSKGQVLFHDELPAGAHRITVTNLGALVMGVDRFVYRPIGTPSSGAGAQTGGAETTQDPTSVTRSSTVFSQAATSTPRAAPFPTPTLPQAKTTPQASDARAAPDSGGQHEVPVRVAVAIGLSCGLGPLLGIAAVIWFLRWNRRRHPGTSGRGGHHGAGSFPPAADLLPAYHASGQNSHRIREEKQLALKRI